MSTSCFVFGFFLYVFFLLFVKMPPFGVFGNFGGIDFLPEREHIQIFAKWSLTF